MDWSFHITAMQRGRPLEFDPERALVAGMELFWQQGYEATSLHDLVDRLGISRSSFYHAFGDKEQLMLQAIALYADRMAENMAAAVATTPDGRSFIVGMFEHIISQHTGRGCLMVNTANELAHRNPRVAEALRTGWSRIESLMLSAIKRGQADGSITSRESPEVIVIYLMTALTGMNSMVKTGTPAAAASAAARLAVQAIA